MWWPRRPRPAVDEERSQEDRLQGWRAPYYIRPVRDTPARAANYVWSVDVAPDGRVWIGHGQGHTNGLGIGIPRAQQHL